VEEGKFLILIENAMIVTMNQTRQIIQDGYILFEKDRIIEVEEGEYIGNRENVHVVDGKEKIMIPGLINAHTHSYANMVKGTTENIPLELWMLYIMAEGKYMSAEDYKINALLGSMEMLKSGTTTFLDHLAQDVDGMKNVATQYKKVGIRAILTPMFGDKAYSDSLPEELNGTIIGNEPHGPSSKAKTNWQDLIAMAEETIQSVMEPELGIGVAIGPSGPQRCSDELLVASMELAEKYNVPWHTHLLETKAQEVTANRLYKKSMVEHLYQLGILQKRISFAHGVWLSEKDIQRIVEHGASVVHNPASNLTLGSGVMPLIPLKEAGVNVALGTDGPNCSGFQSMFESMKLAATLSNTYTPDYERWVKAVDVLEMATIGSAKAVGMESEIGSLEKGKKADVVLLDKNQSSFVPLNNLIWQLVYGRADSAVDSVYVNGAKVVEKGQMTKINEYEIYEHANALAPKLLERCEIDYQKIKENSRIIYDMLMKVAKKTSNRI
jgi:5-methylthioadenosine/S-adenosylhomocysteine deaminase